ncbi:POK9 protein, partial [Heliornis fulica]|nr:POK9 protein [Heliornis fulica]
AGSLGLDLAAAVNVTIMTTRPTKIPTGVFGPLQINGQDYGALLLGRSSISLMGLFVLPGVIDTDFTGEIHIMAHTLFPPLRVMKGQRIAQLIPLPQLTTGLAAQRQEPRQDRGFGSTGTAMLTMDLFTRPKRKVKISHAGSSIELWGLLDTGADTSIVA